MPYKRSLVPEERKWDLSSLFASPEDCEKEMNEIEKKLRKIEGFKGKINAENVIDCLKLRSDIYRGAENVYVYSNMRKDTDTAEPEAQAAAEKASLFMSWSPVST